VDERNELQRIGDALDRRETVEVLPPGVIALEGDCQNAQQQEIGNEQRQRTRRPAAGSRQRPQGRKGSPGRSRAQVARPRVGSVRAAYQRQLDDVRHYFPDLSLLPDEQGLWLLARAPVLDWLEREAIFLIALPDTSNLQVRGWAFWDFGDRISWIGPRHTNLFDGSVCAFAQSDGVWKDGGDLRTLVGLFTLWAFRHLHLEKEDRWPGKQYALLDAYGSPHPYYRRVEFKPEELCSCDNGKRYGDCCKPADDSCNLNLARRHFESQVGGPLSLRHPPTSVIEFITQGGDLPPMKSVHPQLRGK
jgi:hypothetical protein